MKKTKKLLIILSSLIFITLVSFSINAKINKTNKITIENDTIKTNPKIDIKVEREYDDNGNIIRFDSSYSYLYVDSINNFNESYMDSIFNSFRPYFFNNGRDIIQNPFYDFFDNDTLYHQHFFDDDYFIQQFNNQMFQFKEMIEEMDSLRNMFLKEFYPEYPKLKDDNKKHNTKDI